MTPRTESEALFEAFCASHRLDWAPQETATTPTPDCRLIVSGTTVCVEVKQIESDAGFKPGGVHSRTVGDHVRRKIAEAREQLQPVSLAGFPTILLVYNSVDPFQIFGTEIHDFVCAMYGEWTVRLRNGRIEESFHGRNSSVRRNANTSFSAVGHLVRTEHGAKVKLIENVHARNSLPYGDLPECFEVMRVELENAA